MEIKIVIPREIKIVIHGNSMSGRPKGNITGEKTPTSKTPVRGKQLNKSKGVNRLINKWKYN